MKTTGSPPLLSTQGISNENYTEIRPHPFRIALIKKTNKKHTD